MCWGPFQKKNLGRNGVVKFGDITVYYTVFLLSFILVTSDITNAQKYFSKKKKNRIL